MPRQRVPGCRERMAADSSGNSPDVHSGPWAFPGGRGKQVLILWALGPFPEGKGNRHCFFSAEEKG
jgi:hypothetical protein